MNNKQFYREIGEIHEDLIEEARIVQKKCSSNKRWIKLVTVAASVALIVGVAVIGISLINSRNNAFHLSLSKGNIQVYYTNNTSNLQEDYDLVSLSEEELFSKCDTTIFKGTISEIKNIIVNLNGDELYMAIAKINVSKVYRGNCNENDTISMLLPCPISNHVWVEDSGTVSAMREGMTGIFMPTQYSESYSREKNGTKLYYKDIADYGILDGERYAFLETEKGLVFSNLAYKSISNAKTLDEVETYIKSMIN
ncbi:hypothetical protein [[Clostridium] fimetarium]|uniref:Uncharacterized protein n=1 Tax=[Clostridium] fimetarium TaxID=99656 RepID=A0A1I0Q7K3_9FIRM|nr:hypothetical protein [[Clostridium] fimetarium]SEW22773.1 hypothetical protein SAMN05421659_10752 [[Clostridium] fimetarium]